MIAQSPARRRTLRPRFPLPGEGKLDPQIQLIECVVDLGVHRHASNGEKKTQPAYIHEREGLKLKWSVYKIPLPEPD